MTHLTAFSDLERELSSTRRLLARLPDSVTDWAPHSRSASLMGLANHVADLPNRGTAILISDEVDVASRPPSAPAFTRDDLITRFDLACGRLMAALAAMTTETLDRTWTLRLGPTVLLAGPKRDLLRIVAINHLVHHRAQLGVYLRMLDIAIPGMYGPSADEPS